ncbi:hypothetical protein [Nocardia sp. NPDC052566]|uniref:hypothetical protein n=1 Tax=Nocardia sp. NPDC052566 TaxID=3364330 RepID=UPI0037C7594B
MRAAHQLRIEIATVAPEVLLRRAIAHYNDRRKPSDPEATLNSSPPFLQRICVNWLRHTGSHYDRLRDEIRHAGGQALSAEAGAIVKHRVLTEIATRYPWLADEANRQSHAMTTSRRSRR